jgi:hypothetical protein
MHASTAGASDHSTSNAALSSISHLFSSSNAAAAAAAGGDFVQHQHGGSSRYVSSCSLSSSSTPSITSTIASTDHHTDFNSNQNFTTNHTHGGLGAAGDFTSSLGINTGSSHQHEYQKLGSFSDGTTSSIRSRTEDKMSSNGSTTASQQQQNKKKRKKRPRGHPSRPLSAYNLFFKDERQRILDSLPSNSSSNKESQEEVKDPRDEITWPGKRRRPHGKIGFENLAKEIGARWKTIDDRTKEHYKKLALEDLQRYSREMQEYEGRLAMGGLKLHKTSISSSDDDEHQ